MSKIVKAEYYEANTPNQSYGVLYYASGRRTSFYMKFAPKTFDKFCLKHQPYWHDTATIGNTSYDIWVYEEKTDDR